MEAPEPLLAKKRQRAPTTTETAAPVSPAAAAEAHSRAPVAVVVAVVAVAFAGIGYLGWGRLHPAALPRDPGLYVLLVTDRHAARRRARLYGNARRTPAIDRLAARGRRFETAHAHNVVTLPSHANILTGCCRSSTACATTPASASGRTRRRSPRAPARAATHRRASSARSRSTRASAWTRLRRLRRQFRDGADLGPRS